MKKILLSYACCLLALGLVTACDKEEEEPNEPEVPDTVVDDGGETTYLFGFEVDGVMQYIDGGIVEYEGKTYAYEGSVTTDVSNAVAISYEVSGSTYYLSFDNAGVTNWITIVAGDHTNLSYATEKSPIYLHTTDGGAEYFGNEDGSYFLCYNSAYKCLYASSITGTPNNSDVPYIQSSPVAGLYTTDGKLVAGGKGEEPVVVELPDPVEWEVEGTYLFGFNTGSAVQYIDGTTPSGYTYEGNLTTNLTYAVPVTIGEYTASSDEEPDDDNDGNDSDGDEAEDELPAYTLSFELEGVTYYITITISTSGSNTYYNLAYSTEEAPIYWDASNGYWVNKEGTHFLCYNSSYKCLYCSSIEEYGPNGSKGTSTPAATYEYNELPAPTSLEIVGASVVYVGYTTQLSVAVEEGASASVTWSVPEGISALTISEYGLVTGVSASEGDITITATSTVDEAKSATHTIKVVELETPNVGTDTTYKLGCLDSENFTYRWFTGAGQYYLNASTTWDDGLDVYVTGLASDGIDGSCTLSYYDSTSISLKYIVSSENSSNKTNMGVSDEPYVWVWDNENQLFYTPSFEDRFISCHNGNDDFRANALSNASDSEYYHVIPYATKPEDPVRPDPTSLTISGSSYVAVNESLTLTVSAEPYGALADVTWSVTDSTGTNTEAATITEQGVFTATATGEYIVTAKSSIVETVTAEKVITVVEEGAITTESITYETIMNHEAFTGTEWKANTQNNFSSAEGVATAFTGCSITWYNGTGANGCAIYGNNSTPTGYSLRMYYGASFALSAAEGYAIDGVVLNFTGSVSNFEVTNASYTKDNYVYTLSGPIESTSPIIVANTATSSNTFTFADAGIVVTIVNLNYTAD